MRGRGSRRVSRRRPDRRGGRLNSRIRNQYAAAFKPSIELRSNRYVWLGTRKAFEAFTFIFEETEHGWIWAHAYRFEPASTFIVECGEATWRALGFDR